MIMYDLKQSTRYRATVDLPFYISQSAAKSGLEAKGFTDVVFENPTTVVGTWSKPDESVELPDQVKSISPISAGTTPAANVSAGNSTNIATPVQSPGGVILPETTITGQAPSHFPMLTPAQWAALGLAILAGIGIGAALAERKA